MDDYPTMLRTNLDRIVGEFEKKLLARGVYMDVVDKWSDGLKRWFLKRYSLVEPTDPHWSFLIHRRDGKEITEAHYTKMIRSLQRKALELGKFIVNQSKIQLDAGSESRRPERGELKRVIREIIRSVPEVSTKLKEGTSAPSKVVSRIYYEVQKRGIETSRESVRHTVFRLGYCEGRRK
jgi:hypothetical protein